MESYETYNRFIEGYVESYEAYSRFIETLDRMNMLSASWMDDLKRNKSFHFMRITEFDFCDKWSKSK